MIIYIELDNGSSLCVSTGKHKGLCKTRMINGFSEDLVVTVEGKKFNEEIGIYLDSNDRYALISPIASNLAFKNISRDSLVSVDNIYLESEARKEKVSLKLFLSLLNSTSKYNENRSCKCE